MLAESPGTLAWDNIGNGNAGVFKSDILDNSVNINIDNRRNRKGGGGTARPSRQPADSAPAPMPVASASQPVGKSVPCQVANQGATCGVRAAYNDQIAYQGGSTCVGMGGKDSPAGLFESCNYEGA